MDWPYSSDSLETQHSVNSKGWNSKVHREFPINVDSEVLYYNVIHYSTINYIIVYYIL